MRELARLFLDNPLAQRTDAVAARFCLDCSAPEESHVLASLVSRDGRVLRLQGTQVLPGSAFQFEVLAVTDQPAGEPQGQVAENALPAWISPRVERLYQLDLDLQGQLDIWLAQTPSAAVAEVSL